MMKVIAEHNTLRQVGELGGIILGRFISRYVFS